MTQVIRMDGRLEVTECWRCCGDCVIPSCSLWEDLDTCPECEGEGVLYEFVPGPDEASSATSPSSLFVE